MAVAYSPSATPSSMTEPNSRLPFYWLLRKLLLFSMSAFVLLAVVEFGLRAVAANTPNPLPIDYLADSALRSLPALSDVAALATPNQVGTFNGQLHRTNSQGARGPDVAIPKPPSVFRTVVVGDSVTMGLGVAEDDTYSHQLENILNSDSPDLQHEVINLGLPGYNANASVSRLREIGLAYDPDLLVYGWSANDIEGLFYGETSAPRSPPWTSLLLESFLRGQIDGLREMFYPAVDSGILELQQNYLKNPWAWSAFTASLDTLSRISRTRGVCAVVLLHTELDFLHSQHPFTPIYEAVAAAAEERGLYVATSFERYKGQSPRSWWIHPTDLHPNAKAHHVLAEGLKARIDELPTRCRTPKFRPTPVALVDGPVSTASIPGAILQPGLTLLAPVEGDELLWVSVGGQVVRRLLLDMPVGYVEQLPSGNLLNLTRGKLYELDPTGKTVWRYAVPGSVIHHDAIAALDGTYFVSLQTRHPDLDLWYDEIHQVDRSGKVLWKWNSLDHLDPADGIACGIDHKWSDTRDWLHTNSIDLFPDGDLLVSLRNLNQIVRISRETGEITWSWGPGVLGHQHSVKLMENGHILIFDNGFHRNPGRDCDDGICSSRAIEMDPDSGKIVWEFHDPSLFSPGFGDVDRLANGNTLITYGQHFPHAMLAEVSPQGQILWLLESGVSTKALGVARPLLYRSQRVPD